jgi:hypothetical protein
MHLTLKIETTRPPGINSLQQQARSLSQLTLLYPSTRVMKGSDVASPQPRLLKELELALAFAGLGSPAWQQSIQHHQADCRHPELGLCPFVIHHEFDELISTMRMASMRGRGGSAAE